MTAAAILGLFFWMWSHEARHAYEERGRKLPMLIWLAGSFAAICLLLWALLAPLGVIR